MKKINVAILGASGYTGVELIRILVNHPNVKICELIANNNANQEFNEIYDHLTYLNLPRLKSLDSVDLSKIDVIFGCLPHATSQKIFKEIFADKKNSQLRIIDLSADFRIDDPKNYQKFYNHPHQALDLQDFAVYGLSEINRHKIKKAKIIACPGCYPTSCLLPLIPLLKNEMIDFENIVIDSKSAISGAGRNLKIANLFCENNNSVKAYSIGNHRHLAEIQQELSKAINHKIEVEFTPHIIPVNRGIISTIYTKLKNKYSLNDVVNCLEKSYEQEYFVKIVNHELSINNVAGTNLCLIKANQGNKPHSLILTSVIDNLCKGASGQAVQNLNIIFDLDEKTGLEISPLFP